MKKILVRLSALLSLRQSVVLTLLGAVFLVWSLMERAPLRVSAGMTVGQALGTVAFAIYVYVVVRELRHELLRTQYDSDRG